MKIKLYGCKNGHKIDNILFEEFYNTQKINEEKIICYNCNNNKNNIFKKQFLKCLTCKHNLCPLCKSIHNNNHLIIDYDKTNYICQIHNEIYNSYCNKCNINLCKLCQENHKNHEVINYKSIKLNIEEISQKLIEFRKKIDIFNREIKDIITKLNKIIANIEMYYKINSDLVNNYTIENNNYQILQNIINIKYNINIKDIDEIINNNNISNKFQKLMNIYDKISFQQIKYNNFCNNNKFNNNIREINETKKLKELFQNNKTHDLSGSITIKYKIVKDESNIVKIFGFDFVKNNIKNCKII